MPEPVSTTIVPLAAFEAVKKVDDALGVLTKLVDTLTANPGVAAAKLAEVLGEIRKTYVVVDDAVVEYLNLAFEKDALTKGSKMLLDISNGKLEAKVEEGRGHCYRIEHIYGQHLNRWLTRIFKRDALAQFSEVFARLGSADADIFAGLAQVAGALTQRARTLLGALTAGTSETSAKNKAKAVVMADYEQLQPLREKMTKTLIKLERLRGQFLKLAKIA
jgi:hypothetical protein